MIGFVEAILSSFFAVEAELQFNPVNVVSVIDFSTLKKSSGALSKDLDDTLAAPTSFPYFFGLRSTSGVWKKRSTKVEILKQILLVVEMFHSLYSEYVCYPEIFMNIIELLRRICKEYDFPASQLKVRVILHLLFFFDLISSPIPFFSLSFSQLPKGKARADHHRPLGKVKDVADDQKAHGL